MFIVFLKPGDTHGQAFDYFDHHHDDHPHCDNHHQIMIITIMIIMAPVGKHLIALIITIKILTIMIIRLRMINIVTIMAWHLWAAMGKSTEGVVRERRAGGDVQHLNKDILIISVIGDHGHGCWVMSR